MGPSWHTGCTECRCPLIEVKSLNAGLLAVLIAATPQIDLDPELVRPDVALSVVGNAMLRRGNHVRLRIRTDRAAYLTLYRVNTEGRISIVYPASPDLQSVWTPMVSRGVADPTGSLENHTFSIDDYPGVGYVFVIASPVPFDYTSMRDSLGWDMDNLIEDGRVMEDAVAMIADIAVATLPDTIPFSYDEQRYLVGVTLPPMIALPCLGCFPFAGYPFLIPVREWCETFAQTPAPGPWTPAVAAIPVPVLGPGVGLAPPPMPFSDVVRSTAEQIKQRERQAKPPTNPIESLVNGIGAPTPGNRRTAKPRGRGGDRATPAVPARPATGRTSPVPRRRPRH